MGKAHEKIGLQSRISAMIESISDGWTYWRSLVPISSSVSFGLNNPKRSTIFLHSRYSSYAFLAFSSDGLDRASSLNLSTAAKRDFKSMMRQDLFSSRRLVYLLVWLCFLPRVPRPSKAPGRSSPMGPEMYKSSNTISSTWDCSKCLV